MMLKKIPCMLAGLLFTINSSAQNDKSTKASSPVDVLHYAINLQLDWQKKQATGTVSISLKFKQSAKSFSLAASSLLIRSVCTANKQVIDFVYDSAKNDLTLLLNKTYHTGDTLQCIIAYQTQYSNEPDPNLPGGSFGKGIRFFQPTVANPIKRKQAWSQSEMQHAAYWFPCNTDISDLSTTEFTATVNKKLTVISNGTLIEKKESAGQTNTFHYKTEIAHPAYLNAFAVGEYIDLVQYYNGIPLHTFCYPDEKDAAIATTVRLPDMVRFLTEKTGFAFPFRQYAQVMVQDYPFPSLTGQHTFSIISDNMIDDYGTHKDFQYLWDGVEFNALASQWFGNIIIPKKIEDIWLSKSFAQFFEGLYVTEKHGAAEYLLWYHPFETGNIFGDWNNGNRHAIVPDKIDDVENFTNDSYAKYRGALVLRILQQQLGEAAFLKSVQHFIKKNAFKPVTTADLQTAIYEATGNNMQVFFEQWIYKTGHPVFQVTQTYDNNNKQLRLKITQLPKTDSLAAYSQNIFFGGKMKIEIDNRIEEVWLEAKEENNLSFYAATQPKLVNVDVANTWIKEIRSVKPWDEWMHQFLYSKDASARAAAMQELVSILRSGNAGEADKQTIIKAFQTVIESDAYWRIRFNAIGQLRSVQPLPYDTTTTNMLLSVVKKDSFWVKAAALTSLGMTKDSAYADLCISCLDDASDRVVNAAAIALGKTKSSKAFDVLVKLKSRPSWKNQSLMHTLGGLAALGDDRAETIALDALADNRSPRWFLGNGWDYPFVAAQTLATLGKTESAYPVLLQRFNTALKENNKDDIFYQVLLIVTLGNSKGLEIFDILKSKYKNDANAMVAVNAFEEQLQAAVKK
jgi:aminopeptidase N